MDVKNKSILLFCAVAVILLIAVLIAVPVLSGENIETKEIKTQADSGTENTTDYFSSKAYPEYAEGFEVEYYDNYKVVRIIDPWNRESKNCTYLLVQKGTEVPDGYDDADVFYIPVEKVAVLSTTHIPNIVNIGEIESLKAIGNIKYINTQAVIDRYNEGLVCEVSTTDSSSVTNGLDAEKLIETDPDVVFISAIQNPEYDKNSKIRELGLKPALVSEWMERTPLARAEWVKYFSLFYNKEEEANAFFDDIVSRYDNASEIAKEVADKPTVFSGSDQQGTWYMPGGESYLAKLLEDAGADYLWSDDNSTGTVPLDFETVYDRAADADFWIHSGNTMTAEELLANDDRYSSFYAFQERNLYNHNARLNEYGGSEYWESAVARPDIVLMDLVKIFHPDLLPDYELYYYRHLE